MTHLFIFMIVLYWIFLTGVVFLAGAYASRLLITGPAGADVCIPAGKQRCLGETAAWYTFYISLFAFFSNALHLGFHASIMTETPMEEVSSVIWPFLTRTRYGQLNVWRTAFLTALIVVSFIAAKKDTVWARRSGMVLSLALLVVLSMSGHQGVKGYANIPFFLDVLHLVAISLWIGGLFLIRLCFSFFLRQAGVELLDTFKHLFKRFSDLATYCVGAVAVTGVMLLLFTIKSFSILFGKPYGIVLIIKILLVCIILILGGINKFFIVPRLNAADKDKWNEIVVIRRRLYLLATVEVYLGLGVLLATSLLTHLSPEG